MDLFVPDEARLGHVQILGATSRGKTESVILPWLIRDLRRGQSAVLIDGKGDPELAERIQRVVKTLGLPHRVTVFDLGNLEKSATTNPLAQGSAQQITDRMFATFEFEDPYYRSVQYRVAGLLCSILAKDQPEGERSEPKPITFKRIYECLTSVETLSEVINRCKDQTLKTQAMKLLHQDPKERDKQLSGLISQLEPLAIGEVACVVNGKEENKDYQTISQVILDIDQPQIFIALIPTLKYQALGHQLGKCMLQELGWAVGERSSLSGSSFPFTPVYLDEFSAFVYPGFQQILNKARSSKVSLHLSHQSIGDFAIVDRELATIINTNTNVKCLLGLNDPVTADFFAKHLGTLSEEKQTERVKRGGWFAKEERTGDLSVRDVEAYKIHPNRLKNYTRGKGVIHLPTEEGNVTEEIQFQALTEKDLEKRPA